ncbi:MAG: DUF2905 domain-containing protein [Deltaproteobacteria bacterium]|jgi:hypothetical protein|nr:DUF2905 domain-containing protein [Deltaproteobacteria bacterium]
MDSIARTLIIAGATLLALGILLHLSPSVPFLGKLPGDLRIERPGFRLYLPITSCLLISLVLSAVFWLISKIR